MRVPPLDEYVLEVLDVLNPYVRRLALILGASSEPGRSSRRSAGPLSLGPLVVCLLLLGDGQQDPASEV